MTSISKTGPSVDMPSKYTVSRQNEPVKPALKRVGAMAQSQVVAESMIPQSPDVSSAAFVMPSGSHISTWNVTDVVEYIRTTDCCHYANIFLEQVRRTVNVFSIIR